MRSRKTNGAAGASAIGMTMTSKRARAADAAPGRRRGHVATENPSGTIEAA
jgi:hypothetical protein